MEIATILLFMTVVAESPQWIPMPPVKTVEAGSALDFSNMGLQDAPAGKYGWVRAVDGHFEFERLRGVPQRFYGVNLCFTANYPDHALADRLTTRFVRMGYNSIRIHHYDRNFTRVRNGVLELKSEETDRLDYLAAKAIEKGLYLTMDLYVSRKPTWREIGEPGGGDEICPLIKVLVLCHDGAFRNWCEFARLFLTHVNPYTGRAWGREPALLFLPLINEGTFAGAWPQLARVEAFRKAFGEWIRSVRETTPTAYPEVVGDEPPSSLDGIGGKKSRVYANFLAWLERRGFLRMRAFLRDELGVKTLLTNQNCGPHLAPMQVVREDCYDLVDDHAYVDHPKFIGPKKWSPPVRLGNGNATQLGKDGCCAIEDLAFTRVVDKPFTVSEWNWSAPGSHRAQGGLMMGAAASLQDWSGLWRFAYAHKVEELEETPRRLEFFNVATDPVFQSTERAALLLFLRGDVKPCVKGYAHQIDAEALAAKGFEAFGTKPAWKSRVWSAKVGTCLPGRAGEGLEEVPSSRSPSRKTQKDGECSGVILDLKNESLVVDRRRFSGGYAERGSLDCGVVRFATDGRPAAVWAATVDGRDFSEANRIVVSHVTDARNTGMTFEDASGCVMTAWGRAPVQVRVAEATVSVCVGEAKSATVWALAPSGVRLGHVASRLADGRIEFTADVRQPQGACFDYEIAVERGTSGGK